MEEFANLFLRGRTAEDMKKYVRWMRAFALIGAALLIVSAVLSWQKLPF